MSSLDTEKEVVVSNATTEQVNDRMVELLKEILNRLYPVDESPADVGDSPTNPGTANRPTTPRATPVVAETKEEMDDRDLSLYGFLDMLRLGVQIFLCTARLQPGIILFAIDEHPHPVPFVMKHFPEFPLYVLSLLPQIGERVFAEDPALLLKILHGSPYTALLRDLNKFIPNAGLTDDELKRVNTIKNIVIQRAGQNIPIERRYSDVWPKYGNLALMGMAAAVVELDKAAVEHVQGLTDPGRS